MYSFQPYSKNWEGIIDIPNILGRIPTTGAVAAWQLDGDLTDSSDVAGPLTIIAGTPIWASVNANKLGLRVKVGDALNNSSAAVMINGEFTILAVAILRVPIIESVSIPTRVLLSHADTGAGFGSSILYYMYVDAGRNILTPGISGKRCDITNLHCYIFRQSNTTASLWIDGTLISSVSQSPSSASSGSLCIGRAYASDATYNWDGLLARLGIYNSAWSDDQITNVSTAILTGHDGNSFI